MEWARFHGPTPIRAARPHRCTVPRSAACFSLAFALRGVRRTHRMSTAEGATMQPTISPRRRLAMVGLVACAALGSGGEARAAAQDLAAGGASVLEGRTRVGSQANGVGTPIRWSECDPRGRDVQCARIRVPLDWDHPKGRTIRLALVRHLASEPSERIGTLFINPGGPGDTGVGLVQGDPEGVDALGGGRFDVVSWDPRGTNASARVNCFRNQAREDRFWAAGGQIPITKAASKRFVRRIAAFAKRCGKVSGWLLPHVSTADTARDMDHLRVVMGEDKTTYVGLSYGSYLGETYANMFPERVRAMLLEGIVDAPEYAKSAEARAS